MRSDPRDEEFLVLFRRAAWEVAGVRLDELRIDTPVEAIELDSLAVFEVLGWIERELNVRLPEDELVLIRTLRDLTDLVASLRGGDPR